MLKKVFKLVATLVATGVLREMVGLLPVSIDVVGAYPASVRHYVIHVELRYEYPSRVVRVVEAVRLSDVVRIAIRLPGRGSVVGLPTIHAEYIVVVPAFAAKHIVYACCHPLTDECAPSEMISELLNMVRTIDWKDLEAVVEERSCSNGFCSREAVYEHRLASDMLILVYGWFSAWGGYGTTFDVVTPSNADEVVELS